ncbi:MAG: hypothetical protein Q9160_004053 [Pyrenula sp. 1 TL-2023]
MAAPESHADQQSATQTSLQTTSNQVAARYKRAAEFEERIKEAWTDTTVVWPHWLRHGSEDTDNHKEGRRLDGRFWYRRALTSGGYSFVLVDAAKGEVRAAFDHEALAKALNEKDIAGKGESGEQKVDSKNLPFTRIDLPEHGDREGEEVVRFRIDDQKYQFSTRAGGTLTEFEGNFTSSAGNFLEPLKKERPTASTGETYEETSVTFTNQTKGPVDIFWIDYDGLPKFYVCIGSGGSDIRQTCSGHVWRVTDTTAKDKEEKGDDDVKVIASFVAGKPEKDVEQIAEIEEEMKHRVTTEPMPRKKDKDEIDKEKKEDEEWLSRMSYQGPFGADMSMHGSTGLQKVSKKHPKHALRVFVRFHNVWIRSVTNDKDEEADDDEKEGGGQSKNDRREPEVRAVDGETEVPKTNAEKTEERPEQSKDRVQGSEGDVEESKGDLAKNWIDAEIENMKNDAEAMKAKDKEDAESKAGEGSEHNEEEDEKDEDSEAVLNGKATRLTETGTKDNLFDTKKVYQTPANEGRFAVVWQYTPEQDHKITLIESSPKHQLQPRLMQYQCLKPGDKVRIERPRMFDLVSQKEVETDDALFSNPFCLKNMGWSKDGKEYRFLYNQRGHQVVRVIGMNTEGKVRTIVEESFKETFIDYSTKGYVYQLGRSEDDDSKADQKGETEQDEELIWASERDGWNHLHLFDLKTGKLKNQITKGEWVVRAIDRVDESKRQIWLKVLGLVEGQDPYHAHLVRINLDGSGLTVLTEGDGTHSWKWSPSKKYLLDTFSRVDAAPQTILRDGETGKRIAILETSTLSPLLSLGWTPPERFCAPGRDGQTPIYGIIIHPSNFNPTKKYPVLERIYAGPTDFSVPKSFSSPFPKLHALASALSVIIVLIDGMGTNWRSKAFHDVCWRNLRDAGFPDRIAWLKAAAETRPWMDLGNGGRGVGVYGGSAGGANAMAALLWHGEFYKVGLADCGCHDNRMDKIWWNEQWMGAWNPDDEESVKAYDGNSNVVHAGRLKGKLMLTVGEMDTNVDPASTMQVVKKLNETGRDYEMLVLPGKGHGVGLSGEYAVRRMRDFFVRNLRGEETPDWNAE